MDGSIPPPGAAPATGSELEVVVVVPVSSLAQPNIPNIKAPIAVANTALVNMRDSSASSRPFKF